MDFDSQEKILEQRRARYLQQQNFDSPDGRMVGGSYIPTHPLESLAAGLRAYGGMRGEQFVKKELGDLRTKRQGMDADAMARFTSALRGTPAQDIQPLTPNDDEGNQNSVISRPAIAPDSMAAYSALAGAASPQIRQAGIQGMTQIPQMQEQRQFQRDQLTAQNQGRMDIAQSAQQARAEQAMIAHQNRMDMMASQNASREQMAQAQREFQMQMKQMSASMAAGMRQPQAPIAVMGQDGKPILVAPSQAIGMQPWDKKDTGGRLPTSALKLQQEEVDALQTAKSIDADVGALIGQVQNGSIPLGPVRNLISKGQNFAGASTTGSQNFAAFQTGLEKLRNDSLRLNKGVQTEGDAVRAMNELMTNINDPKVVERQLKRIQEINQRAALLRQNNINQIRANFGADPLDDSSVTQGIQPSIGRQNNQSAKGAALNSADSQAEAWAKANPNDPRAAAIKQRLGF
jgi:hypothetical protein